MLGSSKHAGKNSKPARPGNSGPANTLVSHSTEITGDIHFSGELIVEGQVKGNISADHDSDALVRVADQGSVEGEICVPSVIINGMVRGDVRSSKHVELAAKAVVVGNVHYNLIEMVMGSEVNGSLLHSTEDRSVQSSVLHKTDDTELTQSQKTILGN